MLQVPAIPEKVYGEYDEHPGIGGMAELKDGGMLTTHLFKYMWNCRMEWTEAKNNVQVCANLSILSKIQCCIVRFTLLEALVISYISEIHNIEGQIWKHPIVAP